MISNFRGIKIKHFPYKTKINIHSFIHTKMMISNFRGIENNFFSETKIKNHSLYKD